MQLCIGRALLESGLDAVDARALLRHVLSVDLAYLIAHDADFLTDDQRARFLTLAKRRLAGEPVAYITAQREFFSREFKVTPEVLIPRPETEMLVEFACEVLAPEREYSVLDLGAGSGCVAICIALERPRARVLSVDLSEPALAVARENAMLHQAGNVEFMESDWFAALAGTRYDLIVGNPPYVAQSDPHLRQGDLRFEPRLALAAGSDGLECIRAIASGAPRHLVAGGWLALEHGHDQAAAVRGIYSRLGLSLCTSRRDLNGIERVTLGRRG